MSKDLPGRLPQYQCHKRVRAARIVSIESAPESGEILFLDKPDPREVSGSRLAGTQLHVDAAWVRKHMPMIGGYFVQYEDGYSSYSPAEAFESGYSLTSKMDFGDALRALQSGARVARDGWNGKGMFLFLVPGSRFKVNRPPLLGIYEEGCTVDYRPHIDMKTAQGDVVPWVASQSDVLAKDWHMVEEAAE